MRTTGTSSFPSFVELKSWALGNSYKALAPSYMGRMIHILSLIDTKRAKRVLDVGCGLGELTKILCSLRFDTIGVDIAIWDLKTALDRIESPNLNGVVLSSVEAIPFKSEVFDQILCVEVLQYVEDDKKALCEIKRILRSGGNCILSVPNQRFPIVCDPINWILARLDMSMLRIGILSWGGFCDYTP